jgi:hypothetical protein
MGILSPPDATKAGVTGLRVILLGLPGGGLPGKFAAANFHLLRPFCPEFAAANFELATAGFLVLAEHFAHGGLNAIRHFAQERRTRDGGANAQTQVSAIPLELGTNGLFVGQTDGLFVASERCAGSRPTGRPQ